jgi:hypothetical protein
MQPTVANTATTSAVDIAECMREMQELKKEIHDMLINAACSSVPNAPYATPGVVIQLYVAVKKTMFVMYVFVFLANAIVHASELQSTSQANEARPVATTSKNIPSDCWGSTHAEGRHSSDHRFVDTSEILEFSIAKKIVPTLQEQIALKLVYMERVHEKLLLGFMACGHSTVTLI